MLSQLSQRDLLGDQVADTIKRAADVSSCGSYRWTLVRTWSGAPHVCFVGLNPSTADARRDDPTVRRWISFARAWGFGGLTAVNLYPFRTSSPQECQRRSSWLENGPDWAARDALLYVNLPIVVREAKAAALTVACWGSGTWDREFVDHAVEEIQTGEEPWPEIFCFARSKNGSPIHPMARGRNRISDDAQPLLWKGR